MGLRVWGQGLTIRGVRCYRVRGGLSILLTLLRHEEKGFHLLRQQEVGEHLEPSHRVQVCVELHQGLGLVVGQPDGGDALKQRNRHCQGELEGRRNRS